MFRLFENLIDPFRAHDPRMPPPTLAAFYAYYVRQVWPVLLALMGIGLVISLIEVSIFRYVGAIVDIPLHDGLQIEGMFTHQDAHVELETGALGPLRRAKVTVDHFQGGGLQEYMSGRVRPFATGMLGLTRYAGEGDSEIRFMVGAGGGVKLFATENVGAIHQ